jgi:type IV fimbrial biogenesis protein FimT
MDSRSAGFTTIELMIGLLIIAILIGLAAPTFRDFSRNNQVTAANNDLVTALNLARSEALRRGTDVTVCSSADGAICGAAGDWASGWIVFQDDGATGVIASADKVVQKWSGGGASIQVATASPYIQYQPTGTVTNSATVRVSFASCKGKSLRQIQVSAAGSITTQLQSCT